MDIKKQYVYLGKNIDLLGMRFNEGSVYYGEKIEEFLERYPILSKLLIEVENVSKLKINKVVLDNITEELKGILEKEVN
ncbi:hypothetical protein [Streptobacillus moniliformis]|uniref:hypothetical protein n=1 Tax=Streptobacillus moniliformis TaxID=34105 RepID=UPI0007E44D74|nr:hypothetical protein [Streptobacillus moniliformis]